MDSDPTIFDFSAPKGDHFEPPPSSHSIETSSYELRPSFIGTTREQSFFDPTLFIFSAPKGDHLEPPPSSHSTETSSYELRPEFIAMVREQSFFGDKDESPYSHLREFEQLCSCLVIAGMSQDTLK
jgi:hypothetical protein